MTEQKTINSTPISTAHTSVNEALGPTGDYITLDDLPPSNTLRWVARRKAEVVAAVLGGLLSTEDACERYHLSLDEFKSWQRLFDMHGLRGLRTTKVKKYRNSKTATPKKLARSSRVHSHADTLIQSNATA